MALNYSHRPSFSTHMSNDSLVSPIRMVNGYVVEGIAEGDGFVRPWCVNKELQDCFDYGRDRGDMSGSPESLPRDIIDMLPSDPFGMDIDISTTVTAITGWLEDLEVDYSGYGMKSIGSNRDDFGVFAGFNLFWDGSFKIQTSSGNGCFGNKPDASCEDNRSCVDRDATGVLSEYEIEMVDDAEDTVCFTDGDTSFLTTEFEECRVDFGNKSDSSCEGNQNCVGRDMTGELSKYKIETVHDAEEMCCFIDGDTTFLTTEFEDCQLDFRNKPETTYEFNRSCVGPDVTGVLSEYEMEMVDNAEEAMCFTDEETSFITTEFEESGVHYGCSSSGDGESPHVALEFVPACSSSGDGESPHDALEFVLPYLGPRELLSIECVSSSMRSLVVRNNPLLWRRIHIDQPLNERITDDVLLQLTNRAEGNLQCLSLVECPRITDDGLRRVLEENPKLTKLCVPGCTRLSIEGIMSNLMAFKSRKGDFGIERLRIGGLYGVTHEHFENLKNLLGADSHVQHNGYKPHYYLRGSYYLLCDDNRAIDIEVCPRCQKLRLVYDCPAEGCQAKDQALRDVCRACRLCIQRCFQCGRCITNSEYEETFCLDILCVECFKLSLKCQGKQDEEVSSTCNVLLQETGYESCLRG